MFLFADFVNPYGLHSTSTPNSESSSDRLSQFGTARAYQDLDLQNDFPIFDDKSGEGHFMSPRSRTSEFFLGPSEDKFVMTSETNKEESLLDENIDMVDKPGLFGKPEEGKQVIPYSYGIDAKDRIGQFGRELDISSASEYCTVELKPRGDVTDPAVMDSADNNWFENCRSDYDSQQPFPGVDFMYNESERYEPDEEPGAAGDQEQECDSADDMLMLDGLEDEYEVFDLRVVHRKNRSV